MTFTPKVVNNTEGEEGIESKIEIQFSYSCIVLITTMLIPVIIHFIYISKISLK